MPRACTVCWVYSGDGKTPVAHLNFLTHMEGIKESGVRVEGGGTWGAGFFEEIHRCLESPKGQERIPAAPYLQTRERASVELNTCLL